MTAEERREQRLEALWTLHKISGIPVERLEPAYDAGFKAGRSSGTEDAAKWIESKQTVWAFPEAHKIPGCKPEPPDNVWKREWVAAIRALGKQDK